MCDVIRKHRMAAERNHGRLAEHGGTVGVLEQAVASVVDLMHCAGCHELDHGSLLVAFGGGDFCLSALSCATPVLAARFHSSQERFEGVVDQSK